MLRVVISSAALANWLDRISKNYIKIEYSRLVQFVMIQPVYFILISKFIDKFFLSSTQFKKYQKTLYTRSYK